MNCTDRTGIIRDKLLRYAESGGDPVDRGKLAGHLAECAHCREMLTDMRLFLQLASMLDTSAWGGKTSCPDSEELVQLSESPRGLEPVRLDGIKQHLLECHSCGELLKKLIGVNKETVKHGFESNRPVPPKLKSSLGRIVRDLVRSGAVSGDPLVFSFKDHKCLVPADACAAITGRRPPQEQDSVAVTGIEIRGSIEDESGRPASGEKVGLRRNGKIIYTIRANARGGFTFKNLPQGFYEVHARGQHSLVIVSGGVRS